MQFLSIFAWFLNVFWHIWSRYLCETALGTIFSVVVVGYKQLVKKKTQPNIDCVLKFAIFPLLECFRFLFFPLEWNNFWTAGPIFARKKPVDSSEETLHFGHQFFIFILKNVWDMAQNVKTCHQRLFWGKSSIIFACLLCSKVHSESSDRPKSS